MQFPMDVQNLMAVMMKAEFVNLHVVMKEQYFVEVTFYFASYWRHLTPLLYTATVIETLDLVDM